MDKESKKVLDEKYGISDDLEEFAAKVANKQDNPTLHELAKEFPDKTYKDLEKYRNEDRQQEAGVCMMGEMRKDREEINWEEKYKKEHKLRQEAEGELTILKGIETNRVKEAQDALANSLEVNESHQRLNGKLQVRITELEDENKTLHGHSHKRVEAARKAGM